MCMIAIQKRAGMAVVMPVFLWCLAGCGGGDIEKGTACWYGKGYEGRPTASGEIFHATSFTAAHRSLPFGTIVLVKNLENGRTVKVRINDRGPLKGNRIIDLSRAAAEEIDLVRAGVAPVRIEVLRRGPKR